MYTESDYTDMRRALALADAVKGTTHPNPAVGAVIVNRGFVVGAGATQPWRGPHAEVMALQEAGPRARGAKIYVTLEPCNHTGQTPPCTAALVAAGIKEVFVATKDPNPLVSGRGIRFLKSKGIIVHTGLLQTEAARLNEDFFFSITHQKPWITLKLALTLDGRIADSRGRSRWITSPASRVLVHDLRRRHAAIAIGGATALTDNPELTVRHVTGPSPVRIVFASDYRPLRPLKLWQTAATTRTIIVSPGGTQQMRTEADGVELWTTGKRPGKSHMAAFLTMAFNERLTSILVEGGGRLASSLLESRLVNRLCLFYGNRLLGGGIDAFRFKRGLALTSAIRLGAIETTVVDNDFMVTGLPIWEDTCSPD
jgi:diaminohydroxyphosphoribosylaminopyrimidine deaminase/5-amino-6-(5-phosphoribosylamino)uracil reductase